MNIDWLNIINKQLADGIRKGYKSGIVSIVNKNKKKFGFTTALFDIDYTAVDLEAIRNFLLEAFTVAGVGSYQLEEEIKKIAAAYQSGKISKDDWELMVRAKMAEFGIGLGKQPPGAWLDTNLNTAIVSSIGAARWNRLNDPDVTSVYPYLEYRSQRDQRVRESHRVLDGRVFRKDDAIWKTIYPPNGWNCRCYTEPLTEQEVGGKHIEIEYDKKKYTDEVHEDFKRNAAMTDSIWGKWLKAQLSGMPDAEKKILKEKIREYGKGLDTKNSK